MRRHYLRHRRFRHYTGGVSYTPLQLAAAYGFPSGNGHGQKISFIELGGGFDQHNLTAYLVGLGLSGVPPVIFRGVDGAQNAPDGPDGAQGEVELDLCAGCAIAPGAQVYCHMGPNTDAGFVAAIRQARLDGVNVISISWGGPEDQWSASAISAMEAELKACADAGITVCAASGDNGSGDGESGNHVDYPASSQWVLGCGGTALRSASPLDEVVWNDGAGGGATGGGVSSLFPLPDWQKPAATPSKTHRCVPDVAGNADPQTGWVVEVAGQQMVIGGTSAVAPLWAALVARLNQALGRNLGHLAPQLYALAGWSRDITAGSNGTYAAKVGYDCATGLGVPVGAKLLAALRGAAPQPVPVPAPPPPAPAPPPAVRTIVVTGGTLTLDGKAA